MPTVAIGTPVCGPPTWMLLDSLLRLRYPAGWQAMPIRSTRYLAPDIARNYITRRILETDCEWVLWVDSDAQLHPDTLLRLLSWDQPIVAALTFTVSVPVLPTVYRGASGEGQKHWIKVHDVQRWVEEHPELWRGNSATDAAALLEPRPDDALYEVDFTGCHCMLVHRQVLEAIEPPWFRADLEGKDGVGEDRYFCAQARAAGFSVYVDLSVVAGHAYGERRPCGVLDFMAWYSITDWRAKDAQDVEEGDQV